MKIQDAIIISCSAFVMTTSFVVLISDVVRGREIPSQISMNHRQFADSLISELYQNDNECTSSWGVSMAFSLVYPSSVGATEEHIRNTLGYPAGSQQELVWSDVATGIDQSYEGRCIQEGSGGACGIEEPLVKIANSVWIDDDSELNQSYLGVVQDDLFAIAFSSDQAGGAINSWVDNSTLGLIDSVVPQGPLPPSTVLIAINAIYLKAPWEFPFDEANTNQDIFYTSPSSVASTSSEAHFMHKVFTSAFYSQEALAGFQILKLQFTSNLAVIFALPTSDKIGGATSSEVLSAVKQLVKSHVAVALPKFKFESQYRNNLKMALANVGMTEPFVGGFCVFADGICDAFISDIIHKTAIDLNENGVEAAAATMVILDRSEPFDPPVLFMADHPFQFFIYDELEELVLFEGRIGDPGVPEGAPVPALTARHSDNGFWMASFGWDPTEPVFSDPTPGPTPEASTPEPTPELTLQAAGSHTGSTEPPDLSSAYSGARLGVATLAISAMMVLQHIS